MVGTETLLGAATLRWLRDSASGGILTTDTSLRIVGWNRWLVTTTGIAEETAVGRPLMEVLPSFVERGFDQYYAEALTGVVTVLSYTLHRFILPAPVDDPSAQPTPQRARISPLWDGGRVVGTITVVEDVSERVATERELRAQIASSEAARKTAEAASRVKDEFLATLSHEIRTPLNAVLGWTRILKSRSLDGKTLNRAIEVIDRNATVQLTLVSDLLDMSRIATGKLRLAIAPVDLEPVALGAIDVIKPAADAKGVHIDIDLHSVPPVNGDADRLSQVVWNLLSNAVKFTEHGGTVTVSLKVKSGHVTLAVADTGQGIDPTFLPHVFERFTQSDSSASRRHGGLGLGLALVRELVELHGGTVRVDSAGIGHGTTFTVDLPARVEGMVTSRPRIDAADQPSNLDGIRVLIVEDEPDARDVLTRSLQEFGATAATAASAEEAIDYLHACMPSMLPHIVIADIGMPQADGYEFLAQLRRLPRDRGGVIPAIAVTAYAGPADRERSLAAGFTMHIEKPVVPLALAAAIARVAARST
jgi:signal transduction histidine kinase/ActR/RegA family two-component response regulator